ncbi:MAG: RadC family protein [Planctomycetaceae bacterium]
MLPRNDQLRRAKYEKVLQLIGTLGEFTREELQQQCHETSSTFVTAVLKQLTKDGMIETVRGDNGTRLCWRASQGFVPEVWISRQIAGDQITQTPKEERPRERLIQFGAAPLRTAELLAVLIRSGRKGESAVQAGQRIANHCGDRLDTLRAMSPTELKRISTAVSEVAFCQIMAGIELGRRVTESMQRNFPTAKITSTRAAIDYCLHHFSRLAIDGCQEEFHIVTVDTKLQPIARHQITVGTLDASLVHPREVFRPAIRDAAASVLLVHNHPSGDPTPSAEDRAVTERLKHAGEIIGIKVLDHIVVGRNVAVSLADQA